MGRHLALIALVAACSSEAASPPAADPNAIAEAQKVGRSGPLNPRLLRRFKPLRATLSAGELDPEVVTLGRTLYFDPRLSPAQDMSCNTCHPLDRYGVDGEVTSRGRHAKPGLRNAPSTYHAAGLVAQFWDGRAPDVERQVSSPLFSAEEMAATPEHVLATLRSMPEYKRMFAKAFPGTGDPISIGNVTAAIGAFERGLVTPARWDRYLAGDKSALTATELEGLRVFTDVGCVTCHTGEFLGGTMFQRIGQAEPWPNATDRGRMQFTHATADDMVFRVPSLRNVAKTAPYFHDGSAASLDRAISMMAEYQIGTTLTAEQRTAIAAWLGALTGDLPTAYIAAPTLPPATKTTPKPIK